MNKSSGVARCAISRSAEHLALSGVAALDARSAVLRDVFALADALAVTYQKKVQLVFRLMFAAASAAAICYGFFFIFGFSQRTAS